MAARAEHEAKAQQMVVHWGERIAIRRREMRRESDGEPWSQQDLADALDTDQAQVSKWERGLQEPKLASKYALAEVLGIAVDRLFPHYP